FPPRGYAESGGTGCPISIQESPLAVDTDHTPRREETPSIEATARERMSRIVQVRGANHDPGVSQSEDGAGAGASHGRESLIARGPRTHDVELAPEREV